MPGISVIVPAYNRKESIKKCLEAVRQSIYRDYELIVVDSGSRDSTPSLAANYADKVLQPQGGRGDRGYARKYGFSAAASEIIVNLDSDVIIRPDTLAKIHDYFSRHPEIDALTGLLSKDHPNADFFSQYKNLYMHYIFKKLPGRVSFLYGSIYAIRSKVVKMYDSVVTIADDTAFGQKLSSRGVRIAFLDNLEVIHLKKYNLAGFFLNDFKIAFDWANIFLIYRGWYQLGKNKTGYAHSPRVQLISVTITPVIFLLILALPFKYDLFLWIIPLALIWLFCNLGFLVFLKGERGLRFAAISFFVTLADNMVMALGIMSGAVYFFIKTRLFLNSPKVQDTI